MLQRVLWWRQDAPSEEKLERLEQNLSQYCLPLQETVPLFASLLSLPVPENRYPPLNLTPQRQRQKTLEAIFDTHHLSSRVSAHVGKSFLSHTDNAQSVIS
jgi:hypothetical protein